jgi:hypothetical protein
MVIHKFNQLKTVAYSPPLAEVSKFV